MYSHILKQKTGTPLVFLHGFLGNAFDWMGVVEYLDHTCIGLDLPGHGKSPFTKELTIDIPRFHLIGYSMGGRLALSFAKKHPEKIESLTIISTHPGLLTKQERIKRAKQDQKWAELLQTMPIDQFLKKWYDQPIFNSFQPDSKMRKQQNLQELIPSFLHFSLAHQPRYDIDHCIVGEYDEKFKALYKHPTIIEKAGHAIHLEQPKALAITIQRRL